MPTSSGDARTYGSSAIRSANPASNGLPAAANGTPTETAADAISDSWARIIDSVATAIAAPLHGIVVRYVRPAAGRVLVGSSVAAPLGGDGGALAAADNPWFSRLSRNGGTAAVCRDLDLVGDNEAAVLRFRQERFNGSDLGPQLFVVIERKGNAVVVAWFARERGAPPFDGADLRLVVAIQPVLTATWRNDRTIRQQLLGGRFASGVLNRLTLAVIVLDCTGIIWSANDAARHRLAAHWVAEGCRGGWRLRDAASAARLARAAQEVVDGHADTVRTVRLTHPDTGDVLRFVVTALDGGRCGAIPSGPVATAFLASPGQLAPPPAQWLREVYDLSAVEAEVAARLCRGVPPSAIAEGLGISIHTVRSYVKAIFLKLGVHRQAEAVARIHQDLGFLGRI